MSNCNHQGQKIIELKGNTRGLYCGTCGKWIKWVGIDEYNLHRLQGETKIVDNRVANHG